jgi:hypothetical protein
MMQEQEALGLKRVGEPKSFLEYSNGCAVSDEFMEGLVGTYIDLAGIPSPWSPTEEEFNKLLENIHVYDDASSYDRCIFELPIEREGEDPHIYRFTADRSVFVPVQ